MDRIDFSSPEFLHTPQNFLIDLAGKGPVVETRLNGYGRAKLITSKDAIIDFLKSPHRFIADAEKANRAPIKRPGDASRIYNGYADFLWLKDGDAHKHDRIPLDAAFLNYSISALRPHIAEHAQSVIGQMNTNQADLVRDFAAPFAILSILELLGVAQGDQDALLGYCLQLVRPKAVLKHAAQKKALKHLQVYFQNAVSNQAADMRENGIGARLLQNIDTQDSKLGVNLLFQILFAALEPSIQTLTLGALTLSQNPAQLDALKNDWTQTPHAIEEILRYASPMLLTRPRYACDAFEFHGVSFKRGDLVFGVLGCVGMSPAQDIAPDVFDINRNTPDHLAFGVGAHACIGGQIASTICEIGLERLFSEWPALKAQPRPNAKSDADQFNWVKRDDLRALKTLPVELIA